MAAFIAFAKHLIQAKGRYRIHSPFVYEFCTKVLPHDNSLKGDDIEKLRKVWSKDISQVMATDYGAGSRQGSSTTIGTKVKRASRKRRSGELLYRICKYYPVKRGLELGTHIGISGLYQLSGGEFERFVTLEGDPVLAKIARQQFHDWHLNAELHVGPFRQWLEAPSNLSRLRPDYVFIDGDHRYEPTLAYFLQILPYVPDGGIMIWDDIYWSVEMARAWKEIVAHKEVSVSIDLFFLGICFIRRNQAKEHFQLRFWD